MMDDENCVNDEKKCYGNNDEYLPPNSDEEEHSNVVEEEKHEDVIHELDDAPSRKQRAKECNGTNPNNIPKVWKEINEEELEAYIALLISSGAYSSGRKDLSEQWSEEHVRETTGTFLHRQKNNGQECIQKGAKSGFLALGYDYEPEGHNVSVHQQRNNRRQKCSKCPRSADKEIKTTCNKKCEKFVCSTGNHSSQILMCLDCNLA
ncbi:hypothetical protein ANN_24553 [Periplaneta americana]|uniref:PiggyBac transposable element-derived protein domain-containing protein n=1 Tax=Periplaneta americana TaxID=6978 RepID=A0ABQ8S3P6_PERAM|nr:hypothetical protein ANN_24553 [Periplaneta americana]